MARTVYKNPCSCAQHHFGSCGCGAGSGWSTAAPQPRLGLGKGMASGTLPLSGCWQAPGVVTAAMASSHPSLPDSGGERPGLRPRHTGSLSFPGHGPGWPPGVALGAGVTGRHANQTLHLSAQPRVSVSLHRAREEASCSRKLTHRPFLAL